MAHLKIQLEYQTTAGSRPARGFVTLGDDSERDFIRDWLPGAAIQIQTQEFFRGSAAKPIHRGNRRHEHSFTTTREHASEIEALKFLRDHPKDATREGVLHVDIGNDSINYPNAVVQDCRAVSHSGVATTHRYTIQTGDPTQ